MPKCVALSKIQHRCVVVAKLLVRPNDFDNEGFNIVARDEFNAVLPGDLHIFRYVCTFHIICDVTHFCTSQPLKLFREQNICFPG